MAKPAKILLAVALVTFIFSLTEVGTELGWGVAKPIAAVAFILFLINNLLSKEVAQFEEEQRANPQLLSKMSGARPLSQSSDQAHSSTPTATRPAYH